MRAQLTAPAPPVHLRPLLLADRAHLAIAAGAAPWLAVSGSRVAPTGQRVVAGKRSWLLELLP